MLQRRLAARSEEKREMPMRKAMVTIGAEPEERQPLACVLLGSLPGVYEYTVAMVDTGCSLPDRHSGGNEVFAEEPSRVRGLCERT
jgi:hypothetical protein